MTFKGYKTEKAEKKNMLVYLKRYKIDITKIDIIITSHII